MLGINNTSSRKKYQRCCWILLYYYYYILFFLLFLHDVQRRSTISKQFKQEESVFVYVVYSSNNNARSRRHCYLFFSIVFTRDLSVMLWYVLSTANNNNTFRFEGTTAIPSKMNTNFIIQYFYLGVWKDRNKVRICATSLCGTYLCRDARIDFRQARPIVNSKTFKMDIR